MIYLHPREVDALYAKWYKKITRFPTANAWLEFPPTIDWDFYLGTHAKQSPAMTLTFHVPARVHRIDFQL